MDTETTGTTGTSGAAGSSGPVVVGVDGSPAGEHAVVWAADEARLQRRDLALAHAQSRMTTNELLALSNAGIAAGPVSDRIHEEAESVVERARSVAHDRYPEAAIDTHVEVTDARKLLIELSRTASMVVVGTRGHGPVAGLLLGSVSGALVRHSECPVAVVRPAAPSASGVLLAADGSEDSRHVVEHAYREASYRQTSVTLVHCIWDGLAAKARWIPMSEADPEGAEIRLQMAEMVASMSEKFPDVESQLILTRGAIDACLVDLSTRHELLVIGRPPRSLLVRLTVAGLAVPIAEHAHCPVLVVP